MEAALNIISSANTAVKNIKTNHKSGKDSPGNDRIESRGFKETLLSNPVSKKKNPQNRDLLKKLKRLLEMNSTDQKKELKDLDSETLQELQVLLNLPFGKLLGKLQDLTGKSGFNKEDLEIVFDSIKSLNTAVNQVLTENKGEIGTGNINIENKSLDGISQENGSKEEIMTNAKVDEGINLSKDSIENSNNSKGFEVNFLSEKNNNDGKNTDNIKLGNIDSNNPDKLAVDLLANNKKRIANGNKTFSEGLQRENLNELFKEVTTKEEFTLSNHEGDKLENKDFKLLNLNRTDGSPAEISLNNSKSLLTQNGENGQFNDLMGQGQGSYNSSIEGTNSAAMSVSSGSDMAGIIEQITDRIQAQQQGRNQLNLQLEPESLGKVKIQLQLENNELTARLVVENNQVKGYLEQNLEGLKSNLLRQGFNIEQINIESSQSDYSEQFDSQQEFQQQQDSNQEKNPETFSGFTVDDLDSLFSEEEISELPESIINDHRWSHINYIRHRMNLLA